MNPFQPDLWEPVEGFEFTDITYHRAKDVPAVRIAFDRPEVRNAFRPHTVDELLVAFDHARAASDVGCILLTGNGPSPKDGGWSCCSGGDQRIRGRAGYQYASDRFHRFVIDGMADNAAAFDTQRGCRRYHGKGHGSAATTAMSGCLRFAVLASCSRRGGRRNRSSTV